MIKANNQKKRCDKSNGGRKIRVWERKKEQKASPGEFFVQGLPKVAHLDIADELSMCMYFSTLRQGLVWQQVVVASPRNFQSPDQPSKTVSTLALKS